MKKPTEKRRRLLQKLEHIIGKHCYNDFIQNWEGWDHVYDGRQFRYPVKFLKNRESTKIKHTSYSAKSEDILSGHYNFGANDLLIMKALDEVVGFLEKEYRFSVENGPTFPDGELSLEFEEQDVNFEVRVVKNHKTKKSQFQAKVRGGKWMSFTEFERKFGFKPNIT